MASIHMDLTEAVSTHMDELEWVASPQPGVMRKRLEREAAESGRATTIVRYDPGAAFPAHRHPGGEEYFVLQGTFSDENGDFGEGTYVRNPPGSRHEPFSREGCTIFVKLGQMAPTGEPQVMVDTHARAWVATEIEGYWRMPLFTSSQNSEEVTLERLEAGVTVPANAVEGGEEILVLSGDLQVDDTPYPTHSWIRHPAGSHRSIVGGTDCVFWVKRGHLRQGTLQ